MAPTTTAAASGQPNGAGWYNADVTVTLSATDDANGAGVASITYSATGAQAIASTTVPSALTTVNLTVDGTTTITYAAKDVADNVEAPRSEERRVGKECRARGST